MTGDAEAGVVDDADGVPGVDPGQPQHELLAAVAGAEAVRRQVLLEEAGDPAEDAVADEVTVRVVDALEAIDVDERDAQRRPRRLPFGERSVQPLVEVTAVVARRQRVAQAAVAGDVQRGAQMLVGAAPVALGGEEAGDGLVEAKQVRLLRRAARPGGRAAAPGGQAPPHPALGVVPAGGRPLATRGGGGGSWPKG